MLKEKVADLVTDEAINIFCHQTNCWGKMGAGIAKSIAIRYPEVSLKDQEYCVKHSRDLLGINLYVRVSDTRTCVNMYAQFNFGRDKKFTEYDKLQQCLDKLAAKLNISDKSLVVGFPAGMSCGNAGGDWKVVKRMLSDFSDKVPQDVYIVTRPSNDSNLIYLTAAFTGKSDTIRNQWHQITIQVMPKNYLVKCGNTAKYYYSAEDIWAEWSCPDKIELPKPSLYR